jgi:hypothetical protein
MASIHELARAGTLTEAQIRGAKTSINELDANGVPPLTLAARMGHLDTVKLLLREKADPDMKDKNGATALNVAAHYPPMNQAAIIRALLEAGAKVDTTDPKLNNDTPLMTVVTQTRDLASISELLKWGASLTAKNNSGRTAQDLAKAKGDDRVLAALRSKAGGKNLFSRAVTKITGFFMSALDLLNRPLVSGVRFLTRMYNYTPRIRAGPTTEVIMLTSIPLVPKPAIAQHPAKKPLTRHTQQPVPAPGGTIEPAPAAPAEPAPEAPVEEPDETPEETPAEKQEKEIKAQLDQISNKIKESSLSKFTSMDDDFLATLTKKVEALRNDVNTDLGDPRNMRDMINLALYKPVLYCGRHSCVIPQDTDGAALANISV